MEANPEMITLSATNWIIIKEFFVSDLMILKTFIDPIITKKTSTL